jgi:hypothetical protein
LTIPPQDSQPDRRRRASRRRDASETAGGQPAPEPFYELPAETAPVEPAAAVAPEDPSTGLRAGFEPAEAWEEEEDGLLRAPLYDDYAEEESLLRNPYVLAGLAVAVAIVLAAFVVIVFGGSGGGNNGGVIIDPLTPQPGRGVEAKSIATSTVREGPSIEYLEIGTLRSGTDVEVVGKNNDASWFQIYFPVKTQLRGWVPATALRLANEALPGIPVVAVTPIARPTVIQPTAPPEPTQTLTATPSPTGTAGPGPDIAVSILNNNCQPGADLIIVIKNVGAPLANRRISITVSTSDGIKATLGLTLTLEPNASVNIPTGAEVERPRTTVKVDLLDSPPETKTGDNTATCGASGGGGGTSVPPPIATQTPG